MTLIYRRPETGASASQLLWRGGFIFSLGLGYFVVRLQLTGALMQVRLYRRRGDEGENITFTLSWVCIVACDVSCAAVVCCSMCVVA